MHAEIKEVSIKTGIFDRPTLSSTIWTRHFLQYARSTHARISSSSHACMNEPASMTRHACCCCWLLCIAAAGCCYSSQQQQQQLSSSSSMQPAAEQPAASMAAAWACCCFKTGMHAAWHDAASKPDCMLHAMLLLQNRDACCMPCCCFSSSSSCCCAHACVRGCLRDRHHISADTSAQTQAWRI